MYVVKQQQIYLKSCDIHPLAHPRPNPNHRFGRNNWGSGLDNLRIGDSAPSPTPEPPCPRHNDDARKPVCRRSLRKHRQRQREAWIHARTMSVEPGLVFTNVTGHSCSIPQTLPSSSAVDSSSCGMQGRGSPYPRSPRLLLPLHTLIKDRDGRIHKILATDTSVASHDIRAPWGFPPPPLCAA